MFRGKHCKYIAFAIPIEKKLQELIEKMGETLKKKNWGKHCKKYI